MKYRRLDDLDVKGKKVLVRVDFNVPLGNGSVRDDTRIKAALPTIEYLLAEDCSLILLSHMGRPKGQIVADLRLNPVAESLGKLLGIPIKKSDEWRGMEVRNQARGLGAKEILLLENTRFDPGEEKNDQQLAREWAQLADIFINDAFGTAHRAHSSTVGVGRYLPSGAGLLLEKELSALDKLVKGAIKRPYIAVLGGAKVSDKIGVIKSLLAKVDGLLLGGGMANTFLAAQGRAMGSSFLEADEINTAKDLLVKAQQGGKRIFLPIDLVITDRLKGGGKSCTVEDEVPAGWMAVDLGPRTLLDFKKQLAEAGTVFWNGPLGVFEVGEFARGTKEIAEFIAKIDAWTVVGGGDSVAAVNEAGVAPYIDHISTGGGASLEYLEGKLLPGISVLQEEKQ